MRTHSMTAWLIDDEDFEFALMQRVLASQQIPARLRYFSGGEQACEAVGQSEPHEFPQLIFCDIKMPGMDGFAFLQWIRSSRFRCVPVIMRSNSDQIADITRAYQLGANAYHTKPSLVDGLAARMRATFDFWCSCQLPDPACGAAARASRAARSMALSHTKILRVLGVGFKAEELEFLLTQQEFLTKLDETAAKPQHTPEDVTELCRIGGKLLAARRIV